MNGHIGAKLLKIADRKFLIYSLSPPNKLVECIWLADVVPAIRYSRLVKAKLSMQSFAETGNVLQ